MDKNPQNTNIEHILFEKEKFKFFYEKYDSLVFVLVNNRLEDVNETTLNFLGYKNLESLLINNPEISIVNTDVTSTIICIKKNDNNTIELNLNAHALQLGNENNAGYLFLYSDVPQEKLNETTYPIILHDIFDQLLVKVGIIDESGNLSFINSNLNEDLKNTKAPYNIHDIFYNKEISNWVKAIRNCIKQKKVFTDLLRITNEEYFEVLFMPYYLESNNEKQVMFMAREINENYHLENEKTFRHFAEKTNDGIIIWDKKTIHYVNPACEKIFGIKAKNISNDKSLIRKVLHPEDTDKFEQIFKTRDSSKRFTNKFHYKILDKKNQVKWLWNRTVFMTGNIITPDKYASIISDITEQKELEQKLANVRSQQKAIMDNIPHLIWLKDSEGKYVTINKAFAKYHGKSVNEIVGKTDFDLTAKELAEKQIRNDLEIMRNHKSFRGEDFSKSVDGNNWIETFKTPIINNEGITTGITGIAMDITERKKMEVMIKDSEARFKSLLQNSSDAITILDRKGNIIYENAEQGKISKFSYEELWGKSVFNLIHEDDRPIFKDILDDILKFPKKSGSVEFRGLNVNRKWVYVESILSNQISNPAIRGIVINSRDITERKLSELKERVYQDNLIFLSNSALELMGISQLDNIFGYITGKMNEYLNKAIVIAYNYNEDKKIFNAVSHSGISKKDEEKIIKLIGQKITGSKITDLQNIHEKYNQGYLIQFKEENQISDLFEIDTTVYTKLKEEYSINKVYAIRLARDKKLLGNIIIITRNKSIIVNKHIIETFVHQVSVALHRAQLEYELVQAKEKAEESDKLKSAFLANMSHEIRTPINGILGFIELIENEDTPEINRKKYIEIIYNNSKILVNLIDDIIDISKIEAEQIKIEKKDISLNILMNQVYTSFLSNNQFKDKKGVKLRMKKGFTNDNSNIKTDPVRLRQVLTNLVGNAYKFTEEGYIEFGYKLSEDKKELLFYVKDTGIGIPERKKKLIFDRFTQVDHSASRKYGGSGLGLTISKAIIELLQGKIGLESEEGKGSVFKFSLPYEFAKKSEIEKPSVKKTKINYDWSKKTILIAEDDKFSFKFLETFIQQTGIKIIHADDGKKAVDFCKTDVSIDVVLMDIQMPEMNGYEATKNIKKIRKDLPIIAQTANALEEERKKCFAAGCDDYLTKPVSIKEMLAKIDDYLKKNNTP